MDQPRSTLTAKPPKAQPQPSNEKLPVRGSLAQKKETAPIQLQKLNMPGEEQNFGRRLSQSSIRRSTLHIADLEAITKLSTGLQGEPEKPESPPTRTSTSRNSRTNRPRTTKQNTGQENDEFPQKRTIFFGNSSKSHPKGAEALDIKLKNLMHIDNSHYWEANTSIEKILFLSTRKHHPETASLLASGIFLKEYCLT
jgi:hypothetical protein